MYGVNVINDIELQNFLEDIDKSGHVLDKLETIAKEIVSLGFSNPKIIPELNNQINLISDKLFKRRLYYEMSLFYKNILVILKVKNFWDDYKADLIFDYGSSLLMQKKYDEGFAYIFQAYSMDDLTIKEIKHKPEFRKYIYNEFKDTVFINSLYLSSLSKMGSQQYYTELDSFFLYLSFEEEILIYKIFSKFSIHSELMRQSDNISSRDVIFDCFRELCVLVEHKLRSEYLKINEKKSTKLEKTTEMQYLIEEFFKEFSNDNNMSSYINPIKRYWGKKISNNKYSITFSSSDFIKFNDNLRNIFNLHDTSYSSIFGKSFLILQCVRNYVQHQLEFKGEEFLFMKIDELSLSNLYLGGKPDIIKKDVKKNSNYHVFDQVFKKIFESLFFIYCVNEGRTEILDKFKNKI